MNHIKGCVSLKSFYENSSFDEETKLSIAQQLINLMHHLHKVAFIAHLDFNPNNILIWLEDKEVFLIDFGLARSLGDDKSLTYSGMTPDYFAPEQLQKDLRPERG